jgi:polysaccharide deacetylase family protein (PEP-CTERM system associated)
MNHIATVQLQDYYQHKVFESLVSKRHWSRFESRLRSNVNDTLELLRRYDVDATFFALGWIGEKYPDLIRTIAGEGHEIASAGFWGVDRAEVSQTEFREDMKRGKEVLEDASGREICGFRSIRRSLTERDLWHLDLIAEEGFQYDSSLMPAPFCWNGVKNVTGPFVRETRRASITELPHATTRILGFRVPIGGGNFLRQFPERFTYRVFDRWVRDDKKPFVLYFHPWELDPNQPEVSAFGTLMKMRQYRNLGKMRDLLPRYFERAAFTSAARYLGLTPQRVEPRDNEGSDAQPIVVDTARADVHDVSVVVPCHNESKTLPFLVRALDELSDTGRDRYRFSYILVDDKSTDDTLQRLQETFAGSESVSVIALPENRGVSGAIMAGTEAAETEIVCSIDADCSYDPLELLNMIPMLDDDVALVTASPYHKDGSVLGVPEWRLFLSRGLSGIYRFVLRHKLATYTACFRAYRRSKALSVKPTFGDFRGILELLVKLDLSGETILEYPTTLQSRLFGFSKMKTLKVIGKHIDMLTRIRSFRREIQEQRARNE